MVCNYCFENEKIQDLIVSLNVPASDSYICTCGMQNDDIEEIKLYLMDNEELAKFLINIINELYIHEDTHGMGMSARSYVEDGEDPFEFAGLSDLYDVCYDLFEDNLLADFIIDNKPYVDIQNGEEDLFESAYFKVWQHRCFFERDDEDEFGLSNWEIFCKNVKHKAIFFEH